MLFSAGAKPGPAFEEASRPEEPGTILRSALELGRRQFWVILSCFICGVALGALYILLMRPTFVASATILMDPRKGGVQQKSVLGDNPTDSAWIDSQVGILILERPKIAQLVVTKLDVTKDPQFFESNEGVDTSLLAPILSLFRTRNSEKLPSKKSEQELAAEAADVVAGQLEVKRVGLSYLVSINFSSFSREQAIKIANAAADAYVQTELDKKYETLQRASDWLLDRYQTLRKQATAADRAVVEFKNNNNIVTAGGKFINDQQLSEVNERLGVARATVADKKARLDQIESVLKQQETTGTVDATVSDALANPIITRLRGQYLDLVNKVADWSKRFGPDHQAVVNLRNQARDIRNSTHEELKRIGESYKSDLAIAEQNELELEKQLQTIVSQNPSNAQISLRALESSAQSYHNFYDNFLTTYTEAVQQQTSPFPDAGVIAYSTWASVSNPPASRVMIIAVLIGAMAGIGLATLREKIDRTFRTTKQVRGALQVQCIAQLPVVKAARSRRSFSSSSSYTLQLITESPFSRFAEGLRSIKLAADLHADDGSSKVIGLTSSVPREGKSMIAASLAVFTAHLGNKVILVDGDLRKPALSRAFFPNSAGISDALSGKKSLESVILTDPTTGLSFLPTGKLSAAGTSEMLASDAMKTLMHTLRMKYEYVIVDLSPLAPIVDVKAAMHLVDQFVYVVEWGRTEIDVVEHAINETPGIYEKLLGVALNKVNFSTFARYEGYRSKYFQNKHFAAYGFAD